PHLDICQRAVEDGADHGAGEAQLNALPDAVWPAAPAGVYEPHIHPVLLDLLAEQLSIAPRVERKERRAEARTKRGLRLRDTTLGSGDLRRVAADEVVHRLLRRELAHRRQHAKRVGGEEEDV